MSYEQRILKRSRRVACRRCGGEFVAKDRKKVVCDTCKTTCRCGAKKSPVALWCKECRKVSPKCVAQLKRLHALTRSRPNPAKTITVRQKISAALRSGRHARYVTPGYLDRLRQSATYMRSKCRSVSRLERSVGSLLYGFQRQYQLGGFKFDFGSERFKVVVEVNGCWWHACPECHPEGAVYPKQRDAVANDARKAGQASTLGWGLVTVWQHEVEKPKTDPILGVAHALIKVSNYVYAHKGIHIRGGPQAA